MQDLLFTQGKDNLAGIVGKIYYLPVEDVNTLPALSAVGSLETAVANIVCKAGGKKAYEVYLTDESGSVEYKPVGVRDGMAIETILKGRYPANNHNLAKFIRDVQNTPCIIFYQEGADVKLLGVTNLDQATTVLSTAIPCYWDAGDGGKTGALRSDEKGFIFQWKFTCAHPPIIYKGVIPTTPTS
ncbi:MAG: hypothetical protein O9302_00325 [Cyclobacteriaceae bacterium]|jgi:hypothetical protein|nr:hypothetical protein [Cytophagales bacterium]MCZ8326476.1 hypothetical protein [Cyclobacteriaceae bacterium]